MPTEAYRPERDVYRLNPCDYGEESSYSPSAPTEGIPCDYPPYSEEQLLRQVGFRE